MSGGVQFQWSGHSFIYEVSAEENRNEVSTTHPPLVQDPRKCSSQVFLTNEKKVATVVLDANIEHI